MAYHRLRSAFNAFLFLSSFLAAGAAVIALSSCAQISNTYYVQGDNNRLTATDSVNKSTKDLMDLAGSAYGEAQTNGGAK